MFSLYIFSSTVACLSYRYWTRFFLPRSFISSVTPSSSSCEEKNIIKGCKENKGILEAFIFPINVVLFLLKQTAVSSNTLIDYAFSIRFPHLFLVIPFSFQGRITLSLFNKILFNHHPCSPTFSAENQLATLIYSFHPSLFSSRY